jgi:D-3-phosphoglycerate dehydrogenase
MTKQKVLVVGDHFILPGLMHDSLGDLAQRFEIVEASTPFPLEPVRNIAEVREASGSEEQMIAALRGVSICIAHHAPLTERVIENAPDLRLFIVCRGGPVNVNIPAATQRGILVASTPARNAAATAEHTIAMILSAMRLIPQADAAIRKGQWKGDYSWSTAGFELETATVGLIGYGAIGHIVARILKGFGATVLVYDPYAKIDAEEGVRQVELAELLDRSNIVSLHARETPESRGILGAEQIAALQRGSIVVNCARGPLMDYDAVASALCSGHLYAAAADVFPAEPLAHDSSLLQLPNFIMTPHIAGGTRQAAIKATRIASEELGRYLKGERLRYCANPELQGRA